MAATQCRIGNPVTGVVALAIAVEDSLDVVVGPRKVPELPDAAIESHISS
jgi:hypothetical protein